MIIVPNDERQKTGGVAGSLKVAMAPSPAYQTGGVEHRPGHAVSPFFSPFTSLASVSVAIVWSTNWQRLFFTPHQSCVLSMESDDGRSQLPRRRLRRLQPGHDYDW